MATTDDLDTLAALYRTMARIRAFEDAAERASQGGVTAFGQNASGGAAVRGPLHLSTGQEAVAAGVCAHLQRDDLLTSTHRGHGHTLAKGADLTRTMAELFGRASGFNGGRGGSMHIADFSVGMLGANGVVAAGLPIAVGAAHALKLRGAAHVVACFFGDGAAARAQALGIMARSVDGNDVLAVYAAAGELLRAVRSGDGPRLLHALTYRLKGHVSVDPARYRDASELEAAWSDDPIGRARATWQRAGGATAELDAIDRAARAEVEQALAAAAAAPWPEPGAAFDEVQNTGAGMWR